MPFAVRLVQKAAVVLLAAHLAACNGAPTSGPDTQGPVDDVSHTTTLGTVEYTWDPKAGDPKVPAELGGPGFTGEGWTTRTTITQVANPDAPKGGTMTDYTPDWPATLRQEGKDSNSEFNYRAQQLMGEALLSQDPVTLEFVPWLATHWQISDDKSTYRFRINPEARFTDGSEVTAADVVSTWKLLVDPTLLAPSNLVVYGKFEQPVAESKYIVSVKVQEESWRNFIYFATSMVIQSHTATDIGGAAYLDKYQNAYPPMSGPYTVLPEDIVKGSSITLTRRTDWWGAKNPANQGWFNLDKIKFIVVSEPGLAFEKLKKGELDFFHIPKAEWWAKSLPETDAVKRGLLVPRKFFTDAPVGTAGIAINSRVKPLDDVRIRKALQLLMDRKTMIEKLYYNEYYPLTSYWNYGGYANPANEAFEFDDFGAVELLEQAGWTEKNGEGYRVKGGTELSFNLTYASQLSERSLTMFQESCKAAGIRIELQQLTPAARWKNVMQKEYELSAQAWGGLVYPNPETSWKSELADKTDNNNITAFADARVDELLGEYDREYDLNRRVEIIREMDAIIYKAHPYVLEWYSPAQRVAYWNKFDMPESGSIRHARYYNVFFSWWVDPAKEKALAEAMADSSKKMEAPPTELHFWEAWNKAQEARPRKAPAPATEGVPEG